MTTTPPAVTETGIIPSVPIDRLLAHRDAALTELRRIHAAVAAYEAIGEQIQLESGYRFHEPVNRDAYGRSHHPADDAWLAWATKTLDASLWSHLLDKSGLKTFLDARAREQWDEAIAKNQTPALTEENIRSTFRNLYESRDDMFGAGVVNLFSELSWDYKTNKPVKFGKRLIMTYVRDRHGFTDHRTCDKLDDLVRAFCVLNRKPEPDHRRGAYQELSQSRYNEPPPTWEHEYFTLKAFKNGNGHLTFKRPDLVDGLNRILAKQRPDALPPADEPAPRTGTAPIIVAV